MNRPFSKKRTRWERSGNGNERSDAYRHHNWTQRVQNQVYPNMAPWQSPPPLQPHQPPLILHSPYLVHPPPYHMRPPHFQPAEPQNFQPAPPGFEHPQLLHPRNGDNSAASAESFYNPPQVPQGPPKVVTPPAEVPSTSKVLEVPQASVSSNNSSNRHLGPPKPNIKINLLDSAEVSTSRSEPPNMSGEIVAKFPNVSGENVAKSPNVTGEISAKSPKMSGENVAKSPNVTGAIVDKSPNVSGENVAKSPTVSGENVAKSPNVSGENVDNSPNVSKESIAKSPNVTGEIVAKSPKMSGENVAKSPNVSGENVAKSPNVSRKNIVKSPNVSGKTVAKSLNMSGENVTMPSPNASVNKRVTRAETRKRLKKIAKANLSAQTGIKQERNEEASSFENDTSMDVVPQISHSRGELAVTENVLVAYSSPGTENASSNQPQDFSIIENSQEDHNEPTSNLFLQNNLPPPGTEQPEQLLTQPTTIPSQLTESEATTDSVWKSSAASTLASKDISAPAGLDLEDTSASLLPSTEVGPFTESICEQTGPATSTPKRPSHSQATQNEDFMDCTLDTTPDNDSIFQETTQRMDPVPSTSYNNDSSINQLVGVQNMENTVKNGLQATPEKRPSTSNAESLPSKTARIETEVQAYQQQQMQSGDTEDTEIIDFTTAEDSQHLESIQTSVVNVTKSNEISMKNVNIKQEEYIGLTEQLKNEKQQVLQVENNLLKVDLEISEWQAKKYNLENEKKKGNESVIKIQNKKIEILETKCKNQESEINNYKIKANKLQDQINTSIDEKKSLENKIKSTKEKGKQEIQKFKNDKLELKNKIKIAELEKNRLNIQLIDSKSAVTAKEFLLKKVNDNCEKSKREVENLRTQCEREKISLLKVAEEKLKAETDLLEKTKIALKERGTSLAEAQNVIIKNKKILEDLQKSKFELKGSVVALAQALAGYDSHRKLKNNKECCDQSLSEMRTGEIADESGELNIVFKKLIQSNKIYVNDLLKNINSSNTTYENRIKELEGDKTELDLHLNDKKQSLISSQQYVKNLEETIAALKNDLTTLENKVQSDYLEKNLVQKDQERYELEAERLKSQFNTAESENNELKEKLKTLNALAHDVTCIMSQSINLSSSFN